MPKHERQLLSPPELLDLAQEQIRQSRQDLQDLRRAMLAVADTYSNRPWSSPASVLDHAAIIAQREYICRLPLGNRPVDITHWLVTNLGPGH